MDFKQALEFIDGYTDYEKTPVPHAAANYDLRRVEELLGYFDNPHLKTKSVHITGTKGKGSTASMIASTLSTAGHRTGLYTSPHLLTIRERIKIDNNMISEVEFADLFARLQPAVEKVNRRAAYGKITTFELLTAMAFVYFAEKNTNIQVLEVGMGGTYDATNVIKNPDVCVLTSISYDHTEILGKTLTEIASEKCGIIKTTCTVINSPQFEEASAVIRKVCARRKAKLIQVGEEVSWHGDRFDINGQQFIVSGRLGSYNLSIPLLGDHQLVNAATAVAALEVMKERGLKIENEHFERGFATVNWPGRFQIIGRNPLIVLDGAHNADSAQKLAHAIEHYLRFKKAIFVLGVSTDKDIGGIIAGLSPVAGKIIATRSQNPRAMDPALISVAVKNANIDCETVDIVPAAVDRAVALAGKTGMVCVTGSLFVVAEVLATADKFSGC